MMEHSEGVRLFVAGDYTGCSEKVKWEVREKDLWGGLFFPPASDALGGD